MGERILFVSDKNIPTTIRVDRNMTTALRLIGKIDALLPTFDETWKNSGEPMRTWIRRVHVVFLLTKSYLSRLAADYQDLLARQSREREKGALPAFSNELLRKIDEFDAETERLADMFDTIALPLNRVFGKGDLDRQFGKEELDYLRNALRKACPKSYYYAALRDIADVYPSAAIKKLTAPALCGFGYLSELPEPALVYLIMLSRGYRLAPVTVMMNMLSEGVSDEEVDAIEETRFCSLVTTYISPLQSRVFLKLAARYLERIPDDELDEDDALDVRFRENGESDLTDMVLSVLTRSFEDAGISLDDYETPSGLEKFRLEMQSQLLSGFRIKNAERLALPESFCFYANDVDYLWAVRVCVRFFDDYGFDQRPKEPGVFRSATDCFDNDRKLLLNLLDGVPESTLYEEIFDEDEDEAGLDVSRCLQKLFTGRFFNTYTWAMEESDRQSTEEQNRCLAWMIELYLGGGYGSGFLFTNLRSFYEKYSGDEHVEENPYLRFALSVAYTNLHRCDFNTFSSDGRLGGETVSTRARIDALCTVLSMMFGKEIKNNLSFIRLSLDWDKLEDIPKSAILPGGLLSFVSLLAVVAHDLETGQRLTGVYDAAYRSYVLSEVVAEDDWGVDDDWDVNGDAPFIPEQKQEDDSEAVCQAEDYAKQVSVLSDKLAAREKESKQRERGLLEEVSSLKKLILSRDREIDRLKEDNVSLRGEVDAVLSSMNAELPSTQSASSSEEILACLRRLRLGFVGGHMEVLRKLMADGVVPKVQLEESRTTTYNVALDCLIVFTDWASHKIFWAGEKLARTVGCERIFVSGSTNYDLVLQKIWNALPEALKDKA